MHSLRTTFQAKHAARRQPTGPTLDHTTTGEPKGCIGESHDSQPTPDAHATMPSLPQLPKVLLGRRRQNCASLWEKYPAPYLLENVEAEQLAALLREPSHNACSTRKAQAIFNHVKKDGDTKRAYQETRDFIVREMVKDIKFKKEQIGRTSVPKDLGA